MISSLLYMAWGFVCSISLLNWGLLISTLGLGIWYYIQSQFDKFPELPSVKPHWFLGNKSFGSENMVHTIRNFYTATEGHRYALFWNGWSPVILLRDADLIKLVQVSDYESFPDGFFLDPEYVALVGNQFGILDLTGDIYKTTKKLVTPPMSAPRLKKTLPTMHKVVEKMIKYMNAFEEKGEEFDVSDPVKKYALNMVATAGLGMEMDLFKSSEKTDFQKNADSTYDMFKLMLLMLFPKIAKFLRIRIVNPKSEKYFQNLSRDIIRQRRNKDFEVKDALGSLIKVADKNPEYLTEEILLQTLVQLFSDGYAGVSDLLSMNLYYITASPHVQEKAQQEVDKIFEEKDGDNELNEEDMNNLTYIDQIISETNRVACVYNTSRLCVKDWKIPGSDFIIRKGTPVWIPTAGLHMDDKYWENPKEFDPERFSPENKHKINSAAYQPFGFGPRQCLGYNLVRMEIKVIVAHIIRNFSLVSNGEMATPGDIVFDPQGFLTPVGGVKIKIEKRNQI